MLSARQFDFEPQTGKRGYLSLKRLPETNSHSSSRMPPFLKESGKSRPRLLHLARKVINKISGLDFSDRLSRVFTIWLVPVG